MLNKLKRNVRFEIREIKNYLERRKAKKYLRKFNLVFLNETIQNFNQPDLYIGDMHKVKFFKRFKIDMDTLETVPGGKTACIGFAPESQKWYGWSHRAVYGFTIGDVVHKGDVTNSSGWTEEYLKEHPEEDISLPVGFKAKTLEDAKTMALAFAESVS